MNKAKGIYKLTMRMAIFHWKRMLFFALCVALGVAFVFAIGNLSQTITSQISGQAKEMMAGDIEVTSYRKFSEKQKQIFQNLKNEGHRVTRTLWFASMVRGENKNFLASIKAIEDVFPLYGSLEFTSPVGKLQPDACWIDESIHLQHNINIGDDIEVGKALLKVRGIITKEPGRVFGGAQFAPRVMISHSMVANTDLIQFGSRVRRSFLVAVKNSQSVEDTLSSLTKSITDTHIDIKSYKGTQRNVENIMERQTFFFLLVSLVTLIVGAVGMGASTSTFLNEQVENVATFRSLGIETSKIFQIYLSICIVVGILGGILGGALGYLINTFGLAYIIEVLELQIDIQSTVYWKYFAEGVLLSIVIAVGINIHKIYALVAVSPMDIFRGTTNVTIKKGARFLNFASMLIAFFLYVYYKSTLLIASYFCAAIIITIIIDLIMIFLALKIFEKLSHFPSFTIRHGIRQLVRQKGRTLIFLISLTIGFSSINTLNLVYASLANGIFSLTSSKVPNLFLVDVLKKQVDDVKNTIQTHQGASAEFSPLIRARLKSINGKLIERKDKLKLTNKEREKYRWRIREYNLTYKDTLNPSEKIISGQFWKPNEQKPHISLEKDFARRAQLKLGDTLAFDIQGRQIVGKVTSIRAIDWTSMKPNFFVIMPVNILQDAPQMFIASFQLKNKEKLASFQKELSKKYTNISVINVGKILKVVENLTGYFLSALKIVAWFCIIVGIIILVGTLSTGHKERMNQVTLLKTLGCRRSQVIFIDMVEFLCIGFITAILSFLISFGLTMIHNYQFDLETSIHYEQLLTLLFITLLPVVVGLAVNWRTYSAKNFRE